MQDITIPNNTTKATKLGMEVFRDKQYFNTQFAHMSSVFFPDRQALSLNNNYPSTAPDFKVPSPGPIQVNSSSIEQNVSIQEHLNVDISLYNDCDFQHSNSKHMARFPDETSQTVLFNFYSSRKLQLPSRNYFKVLITLTAILSGQF